MRISVLRFFASTLIALPVLLLLCPREGKAIPAFSRLYQTSCTTCHLDFPKLNDFGTAFKDAGFKFPKDDETYLKVPPVLLGAPAQKDVWPKAVWPGQIRVLRSGSDLPRGAAARGRCWRPSWMRCGSSAHTSSTTISR